MGWFQIWGLNKTTSSRFEEMYEASERSLLLGTAVCSCTWPPHLPSSEFRPLPGACNARLPAPGALAAHTTLPTSKCAGADWPPIRRPARCLVGSVTGGM